MGLNIIHVAAKQRPFVKLFAHIRCHYYKNSQAPHSYVAVVIERFH